MIRFAIYVIVLPNKFIDISFKIKISILINFEKLSSFRIGRGIQNKKNLFALSPNSAVKVFQQKYPDAKDVYVIKIYSEEKSNLKDMPKNQEANKKSKRYGIWAWVGALYGPIIFGFLVINLPKVEWKYVFESNKTRKRQGPSKFN